MARKSRLSNEDKLYCMRCDANGFETSDWEYVGAYDSFRNWVKCKKCGFKTLMDIRSE